ncbi:E1 ubiquitin-activating protein uba2 [Batrachochytrium dendrobatidis]|nr:E1 ubiquitin-activating protein uba2 [Batrachochytrium dendrobatidis]KAK5668917.1 E1 ubiquitin-activating protein uba2 [Batrachochytrium dendrobatidis]
MTTGRYSDFAAALGQDLHDRVKTARVLMVGAGGIGCELLKNLVLAGFGNIEVVDLDTIDLSNLNRQFLFRNQHIKKSKANVARETALQFNPSANIKAYHASIYESHFDMAWFKSFDLVMNALDNIAARRHVNLMCMAANVPLIESGTAGYHGQVSLHKYLISSCYDCSPKPTERKVYPVCTIRSTPSEPIHCIVWAKNFLYNILFSSTLEEDNEIDNSESSENAKNIKELKVEANALHTLRETMGHADYGRNVFEKIFQMDIQRLLDMEDLWKTHKKPTILDFNSLLASSDSLFIADPNSLVFDQTAWDLTQNFQIFLSSLDLLSKRLLNSRSSDPSASLRFDKDDELSLNFVTSAANLRAICFHIATKSRFDVKQMAGNIIPAIATTNAIVAGMIVMLAFKILSGQSKTCKNTFVQYGGERSHLLANEPTVSPNPECAVCTVGYFTLRINTHTTSLKDVIDKVVVSGEFGEGSIRDGLGLAGEITIQNDIGLLYDVEFDDNIDTTLEALGVTAQTKLCITNDDDDDLKNVAVTLFIEQWDDAIAGSFELHGNRNIKPRPKSKPAVESVLGSKRPMDDTIDESSSTHKRVKESHDIVLLSDTIEIA